MSYGFFKALRWHVRLHPDAVAFSPLPASPATVPLVLTVYHKGSRSGRCSLRICATRPVCASRIPPAVPERLPFPPCRCQGNNGCVRNRPVGELLWRGWQSSSARCSPARQVRGVRDTFPAAG